MKLVVSESLASILGVMEVLAKWNVRPHLRCGARPSMLIRMETTSSETEPHLHEEKQFRRLFHPKGECNGQESGSEQAREANPPPKPRKARRTTLFPVSSFEGAIAVANAIQKHASGQKVRRLTLFDQMGKSPDSGPSRQLIVNSNRYGLTKGSAVSETSRVDP